MVCIGVVSLGMALGVQGVGGVAFLALLAVGVGCVLMRLYGQTL